MFFIKLMIPLLSLNGLNILNNKQIFNYEYKSNRFIFNVQDLNDNILDKSFTIKYQNNAKSGTYKYNNNFFVYGDDLNKMKNELFFSQASLETENNFNYFTCFQELEKSIIEFSNNTYNLKINNIYREFSYLEKCGKKHSKLLPNCGLNHIHNRGCMKSTLYNCTGCIPVTKKLKYDLSFNQNEFNDYLKSRIIDNKIFNFSKLLNFDNNNSIKFFNKNILSFSFNNLYLKSVIMNSFNKYFASEFEKLYTNKIDSDILDLIIQNIKTNKITTFDHYVSKYLNININYYSFKNNIQYWLDLLEYKDKGEIIYELNNLKETDFSLYIKKYNLQETNNYIWKQLFIFFSNKENLKNVFFNINYKTKLNSSNPIKQISLLDLINKQNSYISYNFSNSELEHNFYEEAIHVSYIKMSSNSKFSYVWISNIGINILNNNWENINIPTEEKPNTWFTFNPKIDYSKIINVNNINEIDSKKFLFENNIIGFPSENININFFNIVFDLNKTIYLSFLDKELLNNLNKNDAILNSNFFKKYIKNIEMIPFDSLGKISVKIKFKDNTELFFDIKGFNSKTISHTNILKEIELSHLNIEEFSNINRDYIMNNLISYLDYKPINSMIYINTSKLDFETNMLNSIKITNNKQELLINIEYKNNTNKLETINIKIINPGNLIEDENNINFNPKKNNNNLLILIPTIFIITIIFISLLLVFVLKKRRKNANQKTN